MLAEVMKVDEDSIKVRGAGDDYPEKADDRRDDGSLDPAQAALNRTVRITARSRCWLVTE
ncbi:MAG TPA: hypothetical protein VIT65_21990 [Microlunatus sp.]